MKTYNYIDNSNVFIEGRRVAAVRSGFASDIGDALRRKVFDNSWQIDYGKLHTFLCGQNKSESGAARLWGSLPKEDSFWQMIESKGFDVQRYEQSPSGKEKKVDVAIAHRMTKDAYTIIDKKSDELTLVAGDKDFEPVVTDLVAEGFRVCVAFWGHAAEELKAAATSFLNLNSYFQHLTR